MTKSYRSRNLSQRCQIAKIGKDGQPLRDGTGQPVLDHGGAFFLKVSGSDCHDRKRLIPEDPVAFFQAKAEEVTAHLRTKGRNVTVTPEMVYAEYTKRFTRPGHTFAPPGQPEEFAVVVPKGLCLNWSHGGGGRGTGSNTSIAVEEMSFFQHVGDDETFAEGSTVETPTSEPSGSRRRGKHRAAQVVPAGSDADAEFELDLG